MVLITGDLTSLVHPLVKEYLHAKEKVVLASQSVQKNPEDWEGVTTHSFDPTSDLFAETMSSYHFDAVIFIATREEQCVWGQAKTSGLMLDGLRNALELTLKSKKGRFILISSTEVYGKSEKRSESDPPEPSSINGKMLETAEEYCRLFHEQYGLDINIVRVPYIYGGDHESNMIHALINEGVENQRLSFKGGKETIGNFLHSEDAASFLRKLLDEAYNSDHFVINLVSTDTLTFNEVEKNLHPLLPNVKVSYAEDQVQFTGSAESQIAKQVFDWIALHNFAKEAPALVKEIVAGKKPQKPGLSHLREKFKGMPAVLKWLELIAGAGIMQLLNQFTGTMVEFRFLDFRLLYVILIGSLHGIRFGLYAAFLASLSILYSWYQSGLDWALLLYNVENWLPIALYVVAGSITGYQRDKKENQIAFQNKQFELMDEKYGVLYGVYEDISQIKDQFREQLLGYRDSFGRIFEITQELDTYRDDDVYLKALGVLESLLSNKSVAIYTLDQKSQYARLAVNSSSLNTTISKSLNLTDFPEVTEDISQERVFRNLALLPDYPAYVAPISKDGVAMALVVIWKADFDQYSTYYYNLVKVVTGLIQFSLIRATLFQTANANALFFPGTKILNAQSFREILNIKLQMRNNHIADFKLVKVETDGKNWQDIESTIKKGIRSTDYVGFLEDEGCYILLSQADETNTSFIIDRLKKQGIKCKEVDENRVLYV